MLEALIAKVPPPKGDPDAPLQALIIDSWFDNYVGVVMLVRIMNGTLRPKDKIQMMATGAQFIRSSSLGVFAPKSTNLASLSAGQVGFIIAGIKELQAAKVGDTVTLVRRPAAEPLPGFKEVKPQVFAGLYPVEANQYDALRDSLEKLKLNDASLQYEPEVSQALGFGFRCGFLGLLHMEIVQERLEREFDMDLITTAPTVVYEVLQARRRTDPGRESGQDAGAFADRRSARADRHREPVHAAGVCGRGDHAVHAQARQADQHAVPRPSGAAHLRNPDGAKSCSISSTV